jgi:hypothetical protein
VWTSPKTVAGTGREYQIKVFMFAAGPNMGKQFFWQV